VTSCVGQYVGDYCRLRISWEIATSKPVLCCNIRGPAKIVVGV
jgi:hypothetical protein